MAKRVTETARFAALIAVVALNFVPNPSYGQQAAPGTRPDPAGGRQGRRQGGTRARGSQRQPVSNDRWREVCGWRSRSAEFPTQPVQRRSQLASIAGRQEAGCDQCHCVWPRWQHLGGRSMHGGTASCGDSPLNPIFEFDPSGKMLKNFGAGLFVYPHGMWVDKEGFVWVTDARGANGQRPAGN